MPGCGGCRHRHPDDRRRCHRIRRRLKPAVACAFPFAVVSVKPPAMNRTGLIIALSIALVVGLLFGIYPELDLKLASLFYDANTHSFPLFNSALARFAREAAMWIAWALALPAIIALIVKLVRPD